MLKTIKRFFSWLRSLFVFDAFSPSASGVPKQIGGSASDEAKEKKVIPRKAKDCLYPYCKVGRPMMVSVGQIAFTHRECRTNFRQMLRKALQRGR